MFVNSVIRINQLLFLKQLKLTSSSKESQRENYEQITEDQKYNKMAIVRLWSVHYWAKTQFYTELFQQKPFSLFIYDISLSIAKNVFGVFSSEKSLLSAF